MSTLLQKIRSYSQSSGQQIGVSQQKAFWLLVLPLALSFLFALFLTIPSTREFTKDLLRENRPVELLTFLFLMIGGGWSIMLAIRCRKAGEHALLTFFYGVTGCLLLIVGMEEIAWGQWFLGFETPEGIKDINVQGELTLHNLEGVHGKTEFIRLFIGLTGMAMVLFDIPFLRKLRPPNLLFIWFATITVLVLPDLYYDYAPEYTDVAALFDMMSELNEAFAAAAVLIYFRYTHTKLGEDAKRPRPR